VKDKILYWLATGQVGASSKAMAFQVLGLPNNKSFPWDAPDFNRCLLFLDAVPEARDHMDKIADISPVWQRFVNSWDEIEACFLDEVGLNWSHGESAPKTYDLIKKVLYE